MKVGTLETNVKPTELRPRRTGISTGNGSKGGGGGNNGGGGNDDNTPKKQQLPEAERFHPNKSRILMWFLLAVVIMTFGGLIGAYIVISSNGVMEWNPFDLPIQVWISTAIIVCSSLTYHFAKKAVFSDDQPQSKKWLIVTTVLGASFISSQLLAWLALARRGVYMGSNPYAGFFYILTAVHAVHVLGGIFSLGSVVLRVWNYDAGEEAFERRKTLTQVVGWYWHFMDGLWLVLLFLLGFWK